MCNILFASPQKFSKRLKINSLDTFDPKNQAAEGESSRNTALLSCREDERLDLARGEAGVPDFEACVAGSGGLILGVVSFADGDGQLGE
jgi:hypothetical protein